jgi:hypothetical protein
MKPTGSIRNRFSVSHGKFKAKKIPPSRCARRESGLQPPNRKPEKEAVVFFVASFVNPCFSFSLFFFF